MASNDLNKNKTLLIAIALIGLFIFIFYKRTFKSAPSQPKQLDLKTTNKPIEKESPKIKVDALSESSKKLIDQPNSAKERTNFSTSVEPNIDVCTRSESDATSRLLLFSLYSQLKSKVNTILIPKSLEKCFEYGVTANYRLVDYSTASKLAFDYFGKQELFVEKVEYFKNYSEFSKNNKTPLSVANKDLVSWLEKNQFSMTEELIVLKIIKNNHAELRSLFAEYEFYPYVNIKPSPDKNNVSQMADAFELIFLPKSNKTKNFILINGTGTHVNWQSQTGKITDEDLQKLSSKKVSLFTFNKFHPIANIIPFLYKRKVNNLTAFNRVLSDKELTDKTIVSFNNDANISPFPVTDFKDRVFISTNSTRSEILSGLKNNYQISFTLKPEVRTALAKDPASKLAMFPQIINAKINIKQLKQFKKITLVGKNEYDPDPYYLLAHLKKLGVSQANILKQGASAFDLMHKFQLIPKSDFHSNFDLAYGKKIEVIKINPSDVKSSVFYERIIKLEALTPKSLNLKKEKRKKKK